MPFIYCRFPRSRQDDDVVTFSVFVNKTLRARASGTIVTVLAVSDYPSAVIPVHNAMNVARGDNPQAVWSIPGTAWMTGPLEIAPGDEIAIVYSGTNVSDLENLDGAKQAAIELKILDVIVPAVATAAGVGFILSAVTAAIGNADLIGTLLGYHQPVPCNGTVFSDAVTFVETELEDLNFGPPAGYPHRLPERDHRHIHKPQPQWPIYDEAGHPSSCGHIAETDVTFSVIRIPSASARFYFLHIDERNLANGVRRLNPPGGSFRRLMRMRL
jgi:hypothetical protein